MARESGAVFAPPTIRDLLAHGYDDVIDVRSPGEFAIDHISRALNLPVLNDEERHRIGTIYCQESKFRARRMGAALIARNIAHHLDTDLAGHPADYRPLVYCWRGGQRSEAFAHICRQVGWRCSILAGGYRSYRRLVNAFFYTDTLPLRPVLIAGPTGSGKTALLGQLARSGLQTLDLEAAAEHRGSIFGHNRTPQPSQKGFESALITSLVACRPELPLFVEAESNRIGRVAIPPSFWEAMRTAPRIQVSADLEARSAYIVHGYQDIATNTAALLDILVRLAPFHPGQRIDHWRSLAASGCHHDLVRDLLVHHYDPLYHKSAQQVPAPPAVTITLPDHSEASLLAAARDIAAHLPEGA